MRSLLRRRCVHGPIPTGALGAVQGRVGAEHEVGGCLVSVPFGDSGRHRLLTGDASEESCDREVGFVCAGGRHRDRELFAAVAGDQVCGSCALLPGLHSGAKQFVAGEVAVCVVECLEVVDVEECQGEGFVESAGAGDGSLQFVIPGSPVQRSGE